MKGMEKEMMVKVLILVVIVAIVAIAVLYPLLSSMLPKQEARAYISRLCPDWVTAHCDAISAENDPSLALDVRGTPKSLAQLCLEYLGETDWSNEETQGKCKALCIGCP